MTPSDVERVLFRQFNYPVAEDGETAVSMEEIAAYAPGRQQVEALRAIRSQVLLRWVDTAEGQRAVSVVSPDRGDGRSFLVANLAVVFSQLGERTLVIDADCVPRVNTNWCGAAPASS